MRADRTGQCVPAAPIFAYLDASSGSWSPACSSSIRFAPVGAAI
jgi:hypothetical protein